MKRKVILMSNDYNLRKISKNVYRVESREDVCSDLFVGSDKALLWDTGYGFGNLHDSVKEVNGNVIAKEKIDM